MSVLYKFHVARYGTAGGPYSVSFRCAEYAMQRNYGKEKKKKKRKKKLKEGDEMR